MQNQSSQWLNVRRDRPDWIYIQGWGAMNPTAVKEAAKNNFPMDQLVGIWWAGGDDDARPAGEGAKGYLSLDFNGVGTNFPVIQDIQKHVVDKGKSQAPKEQGRREFLQPRRLNSMLIAEAIRNAQKITGKKVVTGEDVRRGLETLEHHRGALKEIGCRRLRRADEASPATDHNGHHSAYMAASGTAPSGRQGSDWIAPPMKDKVRPLIEAAAKDYVHKPTPAGRSARSPATSRRKRLVEKSLSPPSRRGEAL